MAINLSQFASSLIPHFYGHFEGNGNTISDLFCNTDFFINDISSIHNSNYGLFRENFGTIVNLNVQAFMEVSFNFGYGELGVIAGSNYGTIGNCTAAGNGYASMMIENNNESVYAGGISGVNNGTIIDCTNYGNIFGTGFVGGITAVNSGTISYTNNYGTISYYNDWSDNAAGGIAGLMYGGLVTYSVNGGLIEYTGYWNDGYIQPAMANIVGWKFSGDYYNNSWYGNVDKGCLRTLIYDIGNIMHTFDQALYVGNREIGREQ